MTDRISGRTLVRRLVRHLVTAPAAHFAAGGAVLFLLLGGPGRPGAGSHRELVVPAARLAAAREAFEHSTHRSPTAAEAIDLEHRVLDEEVLLQHALDLGLAAQAPVQRRLAMLAEFVGEPDAATAERGLGRDDLVIRRILVDSARRLIRSAVRSGEPTDVALADYLAAHPDRFQRPDALRLAVLAPGRPERDAEELPLLDCRDVARRFGLAFVDAIDGERKGWQGPYPSRGERLRVVVREHRPARTATVDEAREALRAAVLEELAERWLTTRTAELRVEMGAVVEEGGRS